LARNIEVADELLAQVVDEDFLHAHHLGLLAGGLQLLALAEVGGEGHHLALIGVLQPAQDDRRIKPARIGEHHLLDLAHLVRDPFLNGALFRLPAGRRQALHPQVVKLARHLRGSLRAQARAGGRAQSR
jgi:hypothetical protein